MAELLAIAALALLWSFLAGELSLFNILVGALLGLLMLSVIQREQERSFSRRLRALLTFLVRFLGELIAANITVAWLTVKRRPRFHPHILAVPLRVESNAAITLLSAAITLLPGTVAMGTSADRRTLYAHAISEADVDRSRQSVTRIEDLILGFMT